VSDSVCTLNSTPNHVCCTARVLETVEKVLKQEAWEASRPESPAKAAFVERFGDLPEWVTGPDMISVDLADFFDAISGGLRGYCV